MLREYTPFEDTDFFGGRRWGGWYDRKGEAVVYGEVVDGLTEVNITDRERGFEGYLRAGVGKLGVVLNRLVTVVYEDYLGEITSFGVNLGGYLASSAREGLPLSLECLGLIEELKKRDESVLVVVDLSVKSLAFFRLKGTDVSGLISRSNWEENLSEGGIEVETLFPGVALRVARGDGALDFMLASEGMVSDCKFREFVATGILRGGSRPGVGRCRDFFKQVFLTARL